jgi:alpha-D-ribose 1-methylphosphonate 5-triphosphate synthase subunit PhnG
MPDHDQSSPEIALRRRRMAVLARAGTAELEAAWAAMPDKPGYRWLRPPEIGLAMVQGRAGGEGAPFNLGEVTVTRCALRLVDGTMGVSYVKGRDKRQAELAALFDALLQRPEQGRALDRAVIAPLEAAQDARRREQGRKAKATAVEFFALVRGEDPK